MVSSNLLIVLVFRWYNNAYVKATIKKPPAVSHCVRWVKTWQLKQLCEKDKRWQADGLRRHGLRGINNTSLDCLLAYPRL